MNSRELTHEQLAGMMDHTFLKAFAQRADFEKLCKEAAENGFAMVCVYGVDGIEIDLAGNLYIGNYGDAEVENQAGTSKYEQIVKERGGKKVAPCLLTSP